MIGGLCWRLSALFMPPERADWLRAMIGEYHHVSPAGRNAFALGCLRVSLIERIRHMTATPPLRIIPGLFGAALLTVLCVANGVKLVSVDPVVGAFLLLAGSLWLAILLTVQSQVPRRVAQLAIIGAMLYGALGALSIAGLPAFAANAAMLKALALEGLILFAVVYAVAQVPYFWAANGAKGAAA